MTELLIGCGRNHLKQSFPGLSGGWDKLTTLDINPDHKPDVVHNLEDLPLPFDDETFDEIHAYEVLEHTGQQGDYKFFFAQFTDFWNLLKPNGYFCGTVPLPTSVWAWGDPSHRRVVPIESFVFLNQAAYIEQIGKTAMSDFRYIYKADFKLLWSQLGLHSARFMLQAVKPSRISV